MPSGMGAGTKPIHNKQKKKESKGEKTEEEELYDKQQREAKKAAEDMKKSLAGKKGPLNTGSQGIKKSGKK